MREKKQQTTTSATETGTNVAATSRASRTENRWNLQIGIHQDLAEKKRFPSIGHRFRGPLKETKPNRQAAFYMEIDGLLTNDWWQLKKSKLRKLSFTFIFEWYSEWLLESSSDFHVGPQKWQGESTTVGTHRCQLIKCPWWSLLSRWSDLHGWNGAWWKMMATY